MAARVSLARALVRRPALLLLDEARRGRASRALARRGACFRAAFPACLSLTHLLCPLLLTMFEMAGVCALALCAFVR